MLSNRSRNCIAAALISLSLTACQQTTKPEASPTSDLTAIPAAEDSDIAGAFFGRDDDLPMRANLLVAGARGKDGMPVNFMDEIDVSSLQVEDFLVIDKNGVEHTPLGVTLRPAAEPGENRTVLLVGEFGDAPDSEPIEVRVVGDLLTLKKSPDTSACSDLKNLKGTKTTDITPLSEGPRIWFAQILTGDLAEESSEKGQVVQVIWQGGVVPVNDDTEQRELAKSYKVFADKDGELMELTPVSIADINDNDNFHQIRVDTDLRIVKVSMPAGVVKDPNADPNPDTETEVRYCEKE